MQAPRHCSQKSLILFCFHFLFVQAHRMMDRACEFPSVAQSVQGAPHSHLYMSGSHIDDPVKWFTQQVGWQMTWNLKRGLGAEMTCCHAEIPGIWLFW